MRRRRADRCLLRASAALDADVPEIAQQLVEEARALDPQHPELEEVTERLLAASELPAAATTDLRRSHQLMSRGLLVLLAVALGLMWAAATMEAADVKVILRQVLITAGAGTPYISQSS